MKFRAHVGVAVLVTLVTACMNGTSPAAQSANSPEDVQTTAELSPRERWDSLGIDDFRIVYSIHNLNGMGGSPEDGVYTVVVAGGKAIECRHESTWPGVSPQCPVSSETGELHHPADVLFSWANRFDPAFTVVEYDVDLYLPVSIDYDDPSTVDEEYEVRVIDFLDTTGS